MRIWIHIASLGVLFQLSCGLLIGASENSSTGWPAWRGPHANGVAPQANPPVLWSENKNIKWKVAIPGKGKSTPIIWENKVFILTAIPTGKKIESATERPAQTGSTEVRPSNRSGDPGSPGGPGGQGGRGGPGGPGGRGGGMRSAKPTELYQFVVLCLDRQTGKALWQQTACEQIPHEGHHPADGTFASNSPLTDGKHIYAYFGSRGLYCYDLDGKLNWSHDFGDMRIAMSFGEGSSPVLCGDTLIVNWDHEGESFITALDKNSGKTKWKQPRNEKTSWSTPVIVQNGEQSQVIVAATGKIRSYDVSNGDLIWECAGLTANVIPTPVIGQDMIYCISGYRGNALLAIKLGGKGDLTSTDAVVWKYNKNTPYVPSPILYEGKLYFFSNNKGILSCFDAKTGQCLIDAQQLEGFSDVYASPIAANGRLYFVGRNGSMLVIKASDKVEILASNRLEDKFDSSPAAVDKELFVRGMEFLYCISE